MTQGSICQVGATKSLGSQGLFGERYMYINIIPSRRCKMHPFFFHSQRLRSYCTSLPAPMGWPLYWERHRNTEVSASSVAAQHPTLIGPNTGHRSWKDTSLMPCLLWHVLPINQINQLQKAVIRETVFFPVFSIYLSSAMSAQQVPEQKLKRLTESLSRL